MNIVLCYPLEARDRALIAAAAPGHTLIEATQQSIAEQLFQADIFCGHARVPVPWDDIVKQGRLRWIQSTAAGLDHCLVPSVIAADEIIVSSASGLVADAVAEQTMALLCGLLRSMPAFFRAQQTREFIRLPTNDLHRKTIGIIGLGGNGRRIAEILAPFRGRILAVDKHPYSQPPWIEALWGLDHLSVLLRESEIVILCLPLNSETKGMFDATVFSQMRPGSWLINVARGPIVVEKDLVAALTSGQLAGAGLDVTEIEPLPPDSLLWQLPNVMISPHVGAQSDHRADITTDLVCDNLKRFFTDRPLINRVDKRLGYPLPEARRPT
ncbi:MAG: D-2-hydroxyacid dehydrogenase [Planctomycetota bacterium]|nr:D-2-hydroxyacid dehydrogenase [Planctomycetota bacterium]